MNARLNIVLRVVAQGRGEIRQMQQALGQLQKTQNMAARSGALGAAAGRGATQVGGFFKTLESGANKLERFGKNLQWTGRQVEFRFTLPLVAAGLMAAKFALDNERAITKVKKVYGDLSTPVKTVNRDMVQLKRVFEALSEIFGVQQSEVAEIAAGWAQAGFTGVALARATRNTIETMILGEMDQAEATRALITIQQQYRLSTLETRDALAVLNVVENETAASLPDLIDGFVRGGAVARSAGVDIKTMAATLAVLVPAVGSGAQAGNALKTIFSRLLAPTKQAKDILAEMGIAVEDTSWRALTGSQRLELLAQKFQSLNPAQRAAASSLIATRFQVARFDQIMRDIVDPMGNYQRALRATADDTKNMAVYQRELGVVLASNPKAFDIMKVKLQNAMARAIVPMLPAILRLTDLFTKLVDAFTELDPATQQMIMGFAALLAITGPLFAYIGTTLTLFGRLAAGVGFVGTKLIQVAGFFFPFIKNGKALQVVARTTAVTAEESFGRMAYAAEASAASVSASAQTTTAGWAEAAQFISAEVAVAGARIEATMQATAARIIVEIRTALAAILEMFSLLIAQVAMLAEDIAAAWAAGMAQTVAANTAATSTIGEEWAMVAFIVMNVMAGLPSWWGTQLALMTGAAYEAGAYITRIFMVSAAGTVIAWEEASALVVGALGGMIPLANAEAAALTSGQTGAASAMVVLWSEASAVSGASLQALPAGAAVAVAETEAIMAGGAAATASTAAAGGAAAAAGISLPVVAAVAAIVAAVVGVVALVITQWDKIKSALHKVFDPFLPYLRSVFEPIAGLFASVWNALPASVQNAMKAVIGIIREAAVAVYEWLSYLNPFAEHSPSLVNQVIDGVDLIGRKYASLAGIGAPLRSSIALLKEFKQVAAMKGLDPDTNQIRTARADTAEAAPSMLPAFDRLADSLPGLRDALARISYEFEKQEAAVSLLEIALERANDAYDAAKKRLDALQKTADFAKNSLDEARQVLEDLENTPIAGMKAMDDQIFATTMREKELRLEILKLEEAGKSVDDIKDKMALLNGEIETLSGQKMDLQLAGAGSDVLGPISARIDDLRKQRIDLNVGGGQTDLEKLQKELEEVQRKAERLDLEKALKFDPLQRQIDEVTNSVKEMPFPELLAKIKAQQSEVARLTTVWDKADEAVRQQQGQVDKLAIERDKIQDVYDAEKKKLDELGDAYDGIEQQINDVTSALTAMAQEAQAAMEKAKDAADSGSGAGLGAGGKSFDIPGGTGALTSEKGNLKKLADDWIKESKKAFGSLNPFQPIVDFARDTWRDVEGFFGGLVDAVRQSWNGLTSIFSETGEFTGIGDIFRGLEPIIDELKQWGEFAKPLGEIFRYIGQVIGEAMIAIGVVIKSTLGLILDVWNAVWPSLAPYVKESFGIVIRFVTAALQTIRGVLEFFLGLITGDWAMAFRGIGNAFMGFLRILRGAWDQVFALFRFGVSLVSDIFGELWSSFGGDNLEFFDDFDRAIGDAFSGAADWLVQAGKDIWNGLWNGLTSGVEAVITWIEDTAQDFIDAFTHPWEIGSPSKLMLRLGLDIMRGLLDGVTAGAMAVVTFLGNIPDRVMEYFGNAGNWLLKAGRGILGGLLTGLRATSAPVFAFVGSIPGRILGFFASAGSWLINAGVGVLRGLYNGLTNMWALVSRWFPGLPRFITGIFSSALGWLVKAGGQILSGLWKGLQVIWGQVSGWLGGLPGMILRAFNGAAGWLVNAGRQVLEGFWNGLKDKASSVGNWIVDKAKDFVHDFTHPWDIFSPSRVTFKVGQNVMQGFQNGMSAGTPSVLAAISSSSKKMVNGFKSGLEVLRDKKFTRGLIIDFTPPANWGKVTSDKYKKHLVDFHDALMQNINEIIPDVTQNLNNLGSDLNPQTFQAALQTQTTTVQNFQRDLSAIIVNGNPELANQIAQLGPDAGGKLAAAFVAQGPGVQSSANVMLVGAQTAVEQTRQAIANQMPAFGLLGQQLGNGLVSQFGGNINLAGITTGAIALAAFAIQTDQSLPLAGVTKGGILSSEFGRGLRMGGVATDQIANARAIFAADRSLPPELQKLGKNNTQAFFTALKLAGVSDEQMAKVAASIRNDRGVDDAAHGKGRTMVEKMNAGGSEAASTSGTIGTKMADLIDRGFRTRARIHSPSQMMRDLGIMLIQGLNQGMSEMIPPVISTTSRLIEGVRKALAGAGGIFQHAWSSIKGAFSGPINWVIDNVINSFIGGINGIASGLGRGAIVHHMGRVAEAHTGGVIGDQKLEKVRSTRTGPNEQWTMMEKGEGVIPRAAMDKMSNTDFEYIRRGQIGMVGQPESDAYMGAKIPNVVREVERSEPRNADSEQGGWWDATMKTITDPMTAAVEAGLKRIPEVKDMIHAAVGLMYATAGRWGGRGEIAVGGAQRIALEAQRFLDDGKSALEEKKKSMGGDLAAWRGKEGSYQAIIKWLSGRGVPFRVTSTVRPGAITSSGNKSLHGFGRAVDLGGPSFGNDTQELGNIFHAFAPVEGILAELIYAGPQTGYNIKNGARVAKYAVPDHHDHVHAALEQGGLALARTGGHVVRVAESHKDEAILPLPGGATQFVQRIMERDHDDEPRTTTEHNHFHGNLVFPNITDGNDAEEFIRNLKSLGED